MIDSILGRLRLVRFFILAPVEWAFMRNGAKLETYKVVQGALRRIF